MFFQTAVAQEISSPVLVKSQWISSQRPSTSDPKAFRAKNGEGSDSTCGLLAHGKGNFDGNPNHPMEVSMGRSSMMDFPARPV